MYLVFFCSLDWVFAVLKSDFVLFFWWNSLLQYDIEEFVIPPTGCMCEVYIIYFYNLVTVADGRQGYPENAPYNAIHVGAASPSLPEAVSCRWLHCHGGAERINILGASFTRKTLCYYEWTVTEVPLCWITAPKVCLNREWSYFFLKIFNFDWEEKGVM